MSENGKEGKQGGRRRRKVRKEEEVGEQSSKMGEAGFQVQVQTGALSKRYIKY